MWATCRILLPMRRVLSPSSERSKEFPTLWEQIVDRDRRKGLLPRTIVGKWRREAWPAAFL